MFFTEYVPCFSIPKHSYRWSPLRDEIKIGTTGFEGLSQPDYAANANCTRTISSNSSTMRGSFSVTSFMRCSLKFGRPLK